MLVILLSDWSGGDSSRGEGGETLTVIDKEEAWVFHVTSDDTGTSAVWAAQRVPDDEVCRVAFSMLACMYMCIYICMHACTEGRRGAVTTQFRRLGFRSLLLSLFVRFAGGDCRTRPDSMKTKKTILHSEPSTFTIMTFL